MTAGEAEVAKGGSSSATRSTASRILRVALMLAPWVFIAYLFRDVDAALAPFSGASLVPMLLGALLMMAAVAGFAVLWIGLLLHLNRGLLSPDVLHLLRAYARSWLARYLPGKVWSLGARVIYTDATVTPGSTVARSLIYEVTLILGSAAVLGLGLWSWGTAGFMLGLPALLVPTAVVIALIWRLDTIIRGTLGLIRRVVGRYWRGAGDVIEGAGRGQGLGAGASVLFTCAYLLNSLLFSLSFVLIASSLADFGWSEAMQLAGFFSLAAVLGVVAFFAPAGLGVREGILAGLAAPVLTAPVAASAVILTRVINVFTDLVFVGLVEGISTLSRRGGVWSGTLPSDETVSAPEGLPKEEALQPGKEASGKSHD